MEDKQDALNWSLTYLRAVVGSDIEENEEYIKALQLSETDNKPSRYELIRCKDGFMAYDHDCNEYLEDKHGDNLFDDINEANKLIEDAVFTNIQHREAV